VVFLKKLRQHRFSFHKINVKNLLQVKNFFLIIFLSIMLSSCLSRVEKRGYIFDVADYELLQEGITSKDRVIKILGSPTLISDLDDKEAWIYYAEETKLLLFFKPKIISRNILVIRFDEENTLEELKKIDLSAEEKKLIFATDFTAVESHKDSLFKSFFSNVGSVKPQ
jgi:outer membrane protein assembly factor BamE (lipoprotein component of BamABCDE complex)